MPLASYSQACPYIHYSDRITLHPDFTIRGTSLADKPLGAQHAIHANGTKVLRALSEGLRYDQLQAIASRSHLDGSDVSQIMGFLNTAGAIQYRQSAYGRLAAMYQQLMARFIGVSYALKVRRQPPSLRGLLGATLHASSPVIFISTLVAGAVTLGGLHNIVDTTLVLSYGQILFIASLLAHEYGHWAELRRHHQPFVLTSTLLRLGIVHKKLTPPQEIAVAIRGPIYGCAIACIGILGMIMYGKPILALLSCVVCCVHLGSLLPWYGDGKAIYKSLKGTLHYG